MGQVPHLALVLRGVEASPGNYDGGRLGLRYRRQRCRRLDAVGAGATYSDDTIR